MPACAHTHTHDLSAEGGCNLHSGPLDVGMFSPSCLGVGTEVAEGSGVAWPKPEVARH